MLLTPGITLAQYNESPRPATRSKEVREKAKEGRATQEAQVKEKRRERMSGFAQRMTIRMEKAIERLERLTSRIQSRIDKIKAEGQDVSSIQNKLDSAKTKLATSKTDLQSAKAELESVITSDNPKEAFSRVRSKIQGIKRQIVEVHRALTSLIGDIKGLKVGQNKQ